MFLILLVGRVVYRKIRILKPKQTLSGKFRDIIFSFLRRILRGASVSHSNASPVY